MLQERYHDYILRQLKEDRKDNEVPNMSVMHCCNNLEVTTVKDTIVSGGFNFVVTVTYCKSCGSKKAMGTGISSGKKLNES